MHIDLNYNLIGERIQLERKKKKLTQAQLAERTGFSVNYIGCIECGSKRGSFHAYFKIVSALGIGFDTILEDVLPKPEYTADDELLKAFHSLSSVDRKLILKIINEIANAHNVSAFRPGYYGRP